jgi:hypothetical protein
VYALFDFSFLISPQQPRLLGMVLTLIRQGKGWGECMVKGNKASKGKVAKNF